MDIAEHAIRQIISQATLQYEARIVSSNRPGLHVTHPRFPSMDSSLLHTYQYSISAFDKLR